MSLFVKTFFLGDLLHDDLQLFLQFGHVLCVFRGVDRPTFKRSISRCKSTCLFPNVYLKKDINVGNAQVFFGHVHGEIRRISNDPLMSTSWRMELINGSIVNEAWVTSSSNSECIPHGGERKDNMHILLHFRNEEIGSGFWVIWNSHRFCSFAMEPRIFFKSSFGKRSGIQPLVIIPLMWTRHSHWQFESL